MYTIGEVSKMFNLPISTLRYYDQQGLFPSIKREGGIRKFDENELEALRVIECLKKSGLEIKEIKQFMEWCKEGRKTYPLRKELLEKQRAVVEEEISHLKKALAMLDFKCWYYQEAIKDGNEERLKKIIPNQLPKEIQETYNASHENK